jgi:hypothetical protein
VVGDLVAGLDVLHGVDPDRAFADARFRVRPAAMIDVACQILSAGAVDRPPAVDLEHVPVVEVVGVRGANALARIFDDEFPATNRFERENTQSRL